MPVCAYCSCDGRLIRGYFAWDHEHAFVCFQVGIRVSEEEGSLLAEKYYHEDYPELVNYVAFSHTVDPPVSLHEQYV